MLMNMNRNRGFSLIEVLITIVILMVGLLGLAGLQGRALTSQMESYQRSQALILLKDMIDRVNANRKNAASYVTELNPAVACPVTGAGSSVASTDLAEWCTALQGAAEVQGTAKVGAMIGARGCITQTAAPASGVPSQYLVAVAWQGLNSTAIPSITCGQNQYGANDALRRVIALPVVIADLN
jgi:type IV pilus assembly protein PilV